MDIFNKMDTQQQYSQARQKMKQGKTKNIFCISLKRAYFFRKDSVIAPNASSRLRNCNNSNNTNKEQRKNLNKQNSV